MSITNSIHVSHKGLNLILLPASDVSLHTTKLTVSNNQDLQSALPYALEDQLVQNVDDLHFSWARTSPSDIHVVVVTDAIMQSLHSEYNEPNTVVLPDILSLPFTNGRWCVVVHGNRALVRTGLYEGFECHRDILAQQIKLFLRDNPIPQKIYYWYQRQDKEDCMPDAVKPITYYSYYRSFKNWIKKNAMLAPNLNLFSGRYQIKQGSQIKLGNWLPAIALLLLSLIIHFGFSWFQIIRYESKQQHLTEQSHKLFSEAFPNVKRIIRPRFQAEQELKRLGASNIDNKSQFFQVYGHTIKTMKNYSDLKMVGFNWKNNRFDYQLEANSMTSIESFNRQLMEQGLNSEVFNFVNDKGKAKSRLRIQAE